MKGCSFYHLIVIVVLLISGCNDGDADNTCEEYDFDVILEFENSTDLQHQFTIYTYKKTSCLGVDGPSNEEITTITVPPNETMEVIVPTVSDDFECNLRVCWDADPGDSPSTVLFPALDCPGGGAGRCLTQNITEDTLVAIPIQDRPPCEEKNGHFYLDIINRLDTTIYIEFGNRRLEWFAGTGNAPIECNEVLCCQFVEKIDPLDTFYYSTRENNYEILLFGISSADYQDIQDINFSFLYTLYDAEMSKADSIMSVDLFGIEKDSIKLIPGGRN